MSDINKKILIQINSLKRKIILVTKKNKLLGTVTDGDLRDSFFLQKNNLSWWMKRKQKEPTAKQN